MRLFFFCALVFSVFACGDDDPPPARTGVNDVRKACEIRATWQSQSTDVCRNCVAIATNPACTCPDAQRSYAGSCNDLHTRRANEASCAAVTGCITACAENDCACIDACYANHEACRSVTAALDGCVADVCTPECR